MRYLAHWVAPPRVMEPNQNRKILLSTQKKYGIPLNREPKPEKVFLKPKNCYLNRKNSIQHASPPLPPSRARNRLKTKKSIPETKKMFFQPEKHTTPRQEAETGKSIPKTRKLLFQQETYVS